MPGDAHRSRAPIESALRADELLCRSDADQVRVTKQLQSSHE
jgi:hypothetical protein